MKATTTLILGSLIASLVGCRVTERAAESAKTVYQDSEERQLKRTLQQTHELGARATTVVLYEVANEFDDDFATFKSKPRIAGYPIRSEHRLNRLGVHDLIETLSDRSSYFPPNHGWACLFEPHHVLQLQGGADTETIVICVHCGDIDFHINKTVIGKSVQPKANALIEAQLKSLISKSVGR
ncbi:MAG: hypothetical protein QOE68_1124 [Thermoanaerobaculia bacterium]|jgi:hypothetical protein|nr:hypothetical protein [Thermoanaerobaculia bacterium]